MEICFIDRNLRALCNSEVALARRWGPERAAVVAQRLAELHALDRLADLAYLPHIKVEEGPNATAVYAGTDLAIIVDSNTAGAPQAPETLIVQAIEERREQH